MTTCCFTGHREIPADVRPGLRTRLEACLCQLIEEKGIYRFRAGGARGFDTLAAVCVLDLKAKYDYLRLDLILPCHNQTRGWPLDEAAAYRRTLAEADRVVYLADRYTDGCMHRRNLQLLFTADLCVAYQTHPGGGTAFTIAHAKEQGLEVIILDDGGDGQIDSPV